MRLGIVIGLALAVALSAAGRWVWSRWRAYGEIDRMKTYEVWA